RRYTCFGLRSVRAPGGDTNQFCRLTKERTMSLAAYLSLNKSKTSESRLRKMLTALGGRCVDIVEAIAEARMHRAILEGELYLKRYKHSSKNDDDLPVLR